MTTRLNKAGGGEDVILTVTVTTMTFCGSSSFGYGPGYMSETSTVILDQAAA